MVAMLWKGMGGCQVAVNSTVRRFEGPENWDPFGAIIRGK